MTSPSARAHHTASMGIIMATMPQASHRTPLHEACDEGNLRVIRLLLQIAPEACQDVDRYRFTPLHLAVHRGNLTVMELVWRTWPEGIQSRNSFSQLPIHYAVRNNDELAVTLCITAWPASVSLKCLNGSTLLHAAIDRMASNGVIQRLLDAYPQALREKDARGMLPLHAAANQGLCDAIPVLLKGWPGAISERSDDKETPHEIARRRGHALTLEALGPPPRAQCVCA